MSSDTDAADARDDDHDDIVYPSALPFVLVHLACFAAIWTGVTWQALTLCAALYWLRIFGIGAGYHRYFSHRAFSTSCHRAPRRRASCGGLPSIGIIICIPTLRSTCTPRGIRAFCTAMSDGSSRASTTPSIW